MHLSDRRRCECALVPGMLLAVVLHIADHPEQMPEALDDVVQALQRAVAEPGADLPMDRRRKLAARCRRTTRAAFTAAQFYETDLHPGASLGKVYLAVALWLRGLFDRGVMEAGECDFVHAYEALSEAMAEHADVLGIMERSAIRAAERLRVFFEQQGYFLLQADQAAA